MAIVMGKKQVVVLLFVRLIASKRRRQIVYISAGFGTLSKVRTALWDLEKIVNAFTESQPVSIYSPPGLAILL